MPPFRSTRKNEYKNIDLTSYHSKRFREETRLSSDFVPVFFQAADELRLKSKISLKHSIVDTKLIASGRVEDVDKETKSIEREGTLALPKNDVELQNAFDSFVRDNLAPFAPELRSIKRVNDSIYRFFDRAFKMDVDHWTEIQAIVLTDENRQDVVDTINRAKELYQDLVGRGKHEVVQNDEPWNVPENINFTIDSVKKDYKKSIMNPYYARTGTNNLSLFEEDSNIEIKFIDYLENSKDVEWWFKNGTRDSSFFAAPYSENGQEKPFYVDFIVKLKDGRIGLFDTKGGIYARTAKDRAEGLAKYIKEENKKGKKLFGGIVVESNGSWRINQNSKYNFEEKQLSNWDFLNL